MNKNKNEKAELLIKTYPKATSVIKKWLTKEMTSAIDSSYDLPKNFEEDMRSSDVINDMLVFIIDTNPHALFEVFDENRVYIHIIADHPDDIPLFSYEILLQDSSVTPLPDWYRNRKEAEAEGMIAGYKLLNSQL